MNKKVFTQSLVGMMALCLLSLPQSLFAATLTFKVLPEAQSSEAAIIEVRVDPQAKQLNVIEGTISFSGPASDKLSVQVENGQSILSIWPQAPTYDSEKKTITFTGGVPNGFTSESLLFRLKLRRTTLGNLTIAYTKGAAYLNDGKGTGESIVSEPLTISSDGFATTDATSAPHKNEKIKYATIIVLIAVIFFIIFYYGYKKNIKK